MMIMIIRKWRKNRYSTVEDTVKGCILLELNKETYLLFRMSKKNSKLVTRVVRITRATHLFRYSWSGHMTREYGRTKLQYLTKAYPDLKSELEKKVVWERLRV